MVPDKQATLQGALGSSLLLLISPVLVQLQQHHRPLHTSKANPGYRMPTYQYQEPIEQGSFTHISPYVQATVQGALGSLPLLLIQSRETRAADYDEQVEHGNVILHSTAFAIIIAAPIGLLVIALLGPVWLSKVQLPLSLDWSALHGTSPVTPDPELV